MAFNLAVLTGRLTSDVELKSTPQNIPVCSFSIAVDRGYGDKKETNFINIVAWRQKAEFISKYFKKGDMIGIEGSIQTRKYQDKNGNNRTIFEVVVNNAQFIGGKKENGAQGNQTNVNIQPQDDYVEMGEIDGDLPF